MQQLIVDAMKTELSLDASLAVLDQMPFAILIKDQNLRFRAINKQFAALLPRKVEELIGMTVAELYPDVAEVFEARERQVLETGIEKFYQETLPNAMGVKRDYFTRVTRIDGGAAGKFVCISLSDVTELNHARLRALEADRLKSEFLANMSHEIRTPLNGVLGVTELLLNSDLSERQQALAQIVSSSGVQLLRVIDDVLDFSHIEAGQMKLSAADFDLEQAIDDVVTLLASKAADKGVDLITHFRPAAPRRLSLDAARMRQILTNLIGNAIKFTDEGHILIEVGADAHHLKIVVEDTGKGIAEADRKRIFKKFVRSDLQDGQVRGGAGLGLTISASLVRLMEGEIGVEAAAHGGARFWFQLPIRRPTPPVYDNKRTIGVIDRHDLRAKATADRLERLGYQSKRLSGEVIDQNIDAVVIGPLDHEFADSEALKGTCIVLTPLADERNEKMDEHRIRRASYPLRGTEVERILHQAFNHETDLSLPPLT